MKVIRINVPLTSVERIFCTGYRTKSGALVQNGLPAGARLEYAQVSLGAPIPSLSLYFVVSHGEGFEKCTPQLKTETQK